MIILRSSTLILLIVSWAILHLNNALADEINQSSYLPPSKLPHVFIRNRPTPPLVELGRLLFFDNRLSGNNKMSCASCHQPDNYWSDGKKVGIGYNGIMLNRSTPTLINVAYNKKQFWDGRASSLEQQSTMPITSAMEMNQDLDVLVFELKDIPGYVKLFNENFPKQGITKSNISRAIAAFQRQLVSRNTAFDRWIAGDKEALSESAIRGFKLFEGKADCAECHSGFNFTNDDFHNIGLPSYYKTDDYGRFNITNIKKDKGSFKTPTLRNIIHTAPYMHDGSIATLEEVIEHYDQGGVKNENIDQDMKKLKLTEREEKDLIEFLKSLSEEVIVNIPTNFPE